MLTNALYLHYQAQKVKAEANLYILLKKSSGIGEHSDIVQECIKWVEQIAEAENALKVLERYTDSKNGS